MEKIVPKVFISYSQDTEIFANKVLDFSNYLRTQGIDCEIDQYNESPIIGWPRWMENQIDVSDFVLILGSKGYLDKQKFMVDSGTGRGVKWEINMIFQKLYNADSMNTKFIPIVFENNDFDFIPTPLQGSTFYNISNEKGIEKLIDRLFGYKGVERPQIGNRPSLPEKERKSLFISNFINFELWEKAEWKGVGVCYYPEIKKLFLLLNFKNEEYGNRIFKEWIANFGVEDINDKIRISLIKGIFPDGIQGYYTLIGSDLDLLVKRAKEQGYNSEEVLYGNVQRVHRIEPKDNYQNYNLFKEKFDETGEYYFCPASFDTNGKININFDLKIKKHKINHRLLEDISKNDIDAIVLNYPY